MEDRARGLFRRAVPPRSRAHRRAAWMCCATSCYGACGCRPRPGPRPRSSKSRWRASAPRSARPTRRSSACRAASIPPWPRCSCTRPSATALICVFIDQGMMRGNEAEHVVEMFAEHLKIPLLAVDARKRFLDKLVGVTDPERKRKIIGEEFIRCFEAEASKLTDARFLVQGTLYSDVIESGTRQAGQDQKPPQRRRPAREDGLRAGRAAAPAIQRRGARRGRGARACPSASSGASRSRARAWASASSARSPPSASTYCSAPTPSSRRRSRTPASTASFGSASPSLPVIRSVGVQGDERTYAYPIAIRAVKSDDAMTADWARLPYELLEKVSSRDHQRGARGQPRRLRRLEQAAEHHRVGVRGSEASGRGVGSGSGSGRSCAT